MAPEAVTLVAVPEATPELAAVGQAVVLEATPELAAVGQAVVLEEAAALVVVPEAAPESVATEQNVAAAVVQTAPVIPVLQVSLIEAILYLESDPVDEERLARISTLPVETVRAALLELEYKYAREESGVELSRLGGGVMLSPKREHWELLKERYGKKNESRLSRAAMETLSIIAYSQPITRSEVEAIRGVQADNMIRLLLEKELIREVGKKDVHGKPVQFGTTKEFLKLFRIQSIADLPKLNESEADRFELQS